MANLSDSASAKKNQIYKIQILHSLEGPKWIMALINSPEAPKAQQLPQSPWNKTTENNTKPLFQIRDVHYKFVYETI